jgi:GNAT superfamily N-acetyltransferase
MVNLSPLSLDDKTEWQSLWNGYLEFYRAEIDLATTDKTFQRLTGPDQVFHGVVARDEQGQAVGFAHWVMHPTTWAQNDYCYLEDLFVIPSRRGIGVGSALIKHVRDWAEDKKCPKVYWLTAESNTVARSLYDRLADRSGMIEYQIPNH